MSQNDEPPRVVAEAGQCHAGRLDWAVQMARAAKAAGCQVWKTQILKPELLAAANYPTYWSGRDGHYTQREAFAAFGVLDTGALCEVREECRLIGIDFAASAFDVGSLDTLAALEPAFVKIASGDITFRRLLEHAARLELPVVISTGAAELWEIDRAVDCLLAGGCPHVALLACTLAYPCPPERAELARIETLRRTFTTIPIGYSDHTESAATGLAAAACGAVMLEKHQARDPLDTSVPDNQMGLPADQLAEYVRWARIGATLRGSGELGALEVESRAKVGARRSLYSARPLAKGEPLRPGDVLELRPHIAGSDPWRAPDLEHATSDVSEGSWMPTLGPPAEVDYGGPIRGLD